MTELILGLMRPAGTVLHRHVRKSDIAARWRCLYPKSSECDPTIEQPSQLLRLLLRPVLRYARYRRRVLAQQVIRKFMRKILVQLESHFVRIGTRRSSRASSAA